MPFSDLFSRRDTTFDETPKRSDLRKRIVPSGSPVIGRAFSQRLASKPKTPIFQRQLHQLQQMVKRDLDEGWIDDDFFETSNSNNRNIPPAPRKSPQWEVSPRPTTRINRTLFPPEGQSRMGYLRDLLKAVPNNIVC